MHYKYICCTALNVSYNYINLNFYFDFGIKYDLSQFLWTCPSLWKIKTWGSESWRLTLWTPPSFPASEHLPFWNDKVCRFSFNLTLSVCLFILPSAYSLYCFSHFSPSAFVFLSGSLFTCFLTPSPLSPFSISLSCSLSLIQEQAVSIVSLIFNLSVPLFLHFALNLVALSDASPRASQKCWSNVTGNMTVP